MKRYIIILLALIGLSKAGAQVFLSLDTCLQLAQKNNLQLVNTQLDIEKAELVKKQALTKYFPQISAQAFGYYAFDPLVKIETKDIINAVDDEQARTQVSELYERYGEELGLQTLFSFFKYGYSAGATAVQPLFVGGQIVNGNRLARLGVEAAQLKADISRRDLELQVEETYWLLVGLTAKQQTLNVVSALLDTLSLDVEAALNAGLVTQSDKLQVELKKSEQQMRQMQLDDALLLAKQALNQLIGLPMQTQINLTDTVAEIMPLPEQNINVAAMPEAKLLNLNIKANKLERDMAIGQALPQLMMGATYGYHNLMLDHGRANGMVFATLRVPLTQWWETAYKIKQTNLAVRQADNQQRYLTEQLQLKQLQTWQQLHQAQQNYKTAQANINDARENMRLMQINYKAGLCSVSELLQAQSVLEQALSRLTDAQINYRLSLRRYEKN